MDSSPIDKAENQLGPYLGSLPSIVQTKLFSYLPNFMDVSQFELVNTKVFDLVGKEYWEKIKEIHLDIDFSPTTPPYGHRALYDPLFRHCSLNNRELVHLDINPIPAALKCLVKKAKKANKLVLHFIIGTTRTLKPGVAKQLQYFLESLISILTDCGKNDFGSITVSGKFLCASNFSLLLSQNYNATHVILLSRGLMALDMTPNDLISLTPMLHLKHLELRQILFREDSLLSALINKPLTYLYISCPDYADPINAERFLFTPLGASKIFAAISESLTELHLTGVPFILQKFVAYCTPFLPKLKTFSYSAGFLLAAPAPNFYSMVQNCPVLKHCFITQSYKLDYAKFIAAYLEYHQNDALVNNLPSVFELKGSTRQFDEFLQSQFESNVTIMNSRIQRYSDEFVELVKKQTSAKIRTESSIITDENDYSLICQYHFDLYNCRLTYTTDSFFA